MEQEKFKAIFSKEIYQLPIRWDGKDFYDTLYKHLKGYREDIKLNFKDPNLHNAVETVCRKICSAVDDSFRGYPGKAYESFKGAMKILNEKPLLIDESKINEEPLYRVVDVGNAAVPDRKRIFHVPFSLRSKMSTKRYSIPGFPSLYLGTSVKLCCTELGKDPQRDYVCVSRFELQTDHRTRFFNEKIQPPVFDNDTFIIFDVSIKPENAVNTLSDDDKMITYTQWYPLISACSYIRAIRNAEYSAEYIIPQLFTQWVRSETEDAVVGIKYFSCAPAMSTLGNNYVFPSTGTPYHVRKKITNYCARLSNRFKLTTPRFIMEYVSIDDCVDYINNDEDLKYIEDHNAGEEVIIEEEYSIPEGISSIGSFAFLKCELLKSINIPDSVTSIGDYAFCDCSSLTSINISESVTSIGDCTYWGCSSLTSINIPESVTSIGRGIFIGCSSLSSITVHSSNGYYTSTDGILYNKDKTELLCFPAGIYQTEFEFEIPESVTSIGDYTFHGCSLLTSINIPERVTSIGVAAFFNCDSLTSINIPERVTSIGDSAFFWCSSLTSIKIPESVTSIGDSAFLWCSSLTSIKIPESVTSIGEYAYFNCSSLTSINIPKRVTSIGEKAFSRCSSLTSINIPESVTSIGYDAFNECSSLDTVYFSGTEKQAENIIIGPNNECLKSARWVYSPVGK